MARVLHLYGGWPGHFPYEVGAWTRELLDELGWEVEASNDIFTLDRDLSGFDLIVIGWNNAVTTETLTQAQENRLLAAIEGGTGLAAWHGAAAAFRASLRYHMVLGGSFIEHPAGEGYPHPYRVELLDRDHPVTRGVADFEVRSEQYYMQVDPNNHVLADTTFDGKPFPWLAGKRSPVAWVRNWGAGRVFYHSIGHDTGNLACPQVRRLTRQGLQWAVRA
ncbi:MULTISPECIES: ThuA domain-containing protein [unclassified Burkholderia]|uniref:ThuA domain-containing protein n=1 Tax=unclassified Burkholderia TaxID=2613784 RepID=UPI00141E5725|nr:MULTISPECIES: ThuA domain-containing protein [unclassified Burkholderia]NIE86203.1 ThuA domain-containing protein [Burkholderia sp. Tr-860]NIF65202.1 ThuA domain-containing protein [Burkholderia sp. Cy-647]NIF74172.1 ThuA domain-containing protein [Burkholderia sp. Ap-962]NIF96236.1 ThuA domain-containing protein [Burkholderia sp. Ax-1720]